VTNTLSYNNTELITSVKNLIIQAPLVLEKVFVDLSTRASDTSFLRRRRQRYDASSNDVSTNDVLPYDVLPGDGLRNNNFPCDILSHDKFFC